MLSRGKSKGGFGKLLLAGAAAYAYYRYTKMSPEQKRDLTNNLKNKGTQILDQFRGATGNLRNSFSKQSDSFSKQTNSFDETNSF